MPESEQKKLELLNRLIRKKSDKLLQCSSGDQKEIEKIEKDMIDELKLFGIEETETKELFSTMKNIHLS